MTQYLISISSDNQWGADWEKRRFDNAGKYTLYQGYDQLNDLLETDLPLNSQEFLDEVKSKIRQLIISSDYQSAYQSKLKSLDGEYNFVIVDNVGDHGIPGYQKSIELKECYEFAHVDEITDSNNISGLEQMNRLYMASKSLTKTTFINHNFPQQIRAIDLPTYEGVK